jgi:valyl-tRNA synthetase
VPQWFCDCTGMAEKSMAVVRDGSLKLIPDYHEKIWYNWLENTKDWCISRQLWWGHRIPAYFVTVLDPAVPQVRANRRTWPACPSSANDKSPQRLTAPCRRATTRTATTG